MFEEPLPKAVGLMRLDFGCLFSDNGLLFMH